jgi:hypothetical protein
MPKKRKKAGDSGSFSSSSATGLQRLIEEYGDIITNDKANEASIKLGEQAAIEERSLAPEKSRKTLRKIKGFMKIIAQEKKTPKAIKVSIRTLKNTYNNYQGNFKKFDDGIRRGKKGTDEPWSTASMRSVEKGVVSAGLAPGSAAAAAIREAQLLSGTSRQRTCYTGHATSKYGPFQHNTGKSAIFTKGGLDTTSQHDFVNRYRVGMTQKVAKKSRAKGAEKLLAHLREGLAVNLKTMHGPATASNMVGMSKPSHAKQQTIEREWQKRHALVLRETDPSTYKTQPANNPWEPDFSGDVRTFTTGRPISPMRTFGDADEPWRAPVTFSGSGDNAGGADDEAVSAESADGEAAAAIF